MDLLSAFMLWVDVIWIQLTQTMSTDGIFFLAQQEIRLEPTGCRLLKDEYVGSFVKWTTALNN